MKTVCRFSVPKISLIWDHISQVIRKCNRGPFFKTV